MFWRVVRWLALIFTIFYIGTHPGPAAEMASNIGGFFADLFENVGEFLTRWSESW